MLKTKNNPIHQGLELGGTPYHSSEVPGTVKLLVFLIFSNASAVGLRMTLNSWHHG
jgi:hypothetical protein